MKKTSYRTNAVPRSQQVAVIATVPIFLREFFLAYSGGLSLLVRAVFWRIQLLSVNRRLLLAVFWLGAVSLHLTAVKKWHMHLFSRCLRGSSITKCHSGVALTETWQLVQQCMQTVRQQGGQTGDWQALKRQKLKVCETRNKGQLKATLRRTVNGNSKDGEDEKPVTSGNRSHLRSWPVDHLHL